MTFKHGLLNAGAHIRISPSSEVISDYTTAEVADELFAIATLTMRISTRLKPAKSLLPDHTSFNASVPIHAQRVKQPPFTGI